MRRTSPVLPPGWFSSQDAAEYRYLVNRLPDGATMVEVGVWLGRSLCTIADLVKKKHLTVYAVDIFTKINAQGHPPVKGGQRLMFDRNMARFGLKPIVMAMPSMDVAVAFKGLADFVFFDADHTYPAVLHEIAAWRLKTTRLMGGHDYNRDGFLHPGVKKAVDESFGSVHIRGAVWSSVLA